MAEAMRAPLASCTVPRNDPREFCACSVAANRLITAAIAHMVSRKFFFMMGVSVGQVRIALVFGD